MDEGNPGWNGRERNGRRTVDRQRKMAIRNQKTSLVFRKQYICTRCITFLLLNESLNMLCHEATIIHCSINQESIRQSIRNVTLWKDLLVCILILYFRTCEMLICNKITQIRPTHMCTQLQARSALAHHSLVCGTHCHQGSSMQWNALL